MMMTAKSVLYVANVDENDVDGKGPLAMRVRERAKQEIGKALDDVRYIAPLVLRHRLICTGDRTPDRALAEAREHPVVI